MSDFVLDCSIAMAWHFEDEADAYAEAVLDALKTQRARVPVLFCHEVANVLLVAERKQRTTRVKADAFWSELEALPIEIDATSPLESSARVFALARAHELTAYDATYLELAERLRLPLLTLDNDLRRAAASAAVSISMVVRGGS